MDAGVVSNFRPQAYASRMAAERVKTGARPPGAFEISRLPVAERPPAAESRAGPSAASALLSDAPRHRPRRAALHPAPRRSQRRLTPFFTSPLTARRTIALGASAVSRAPGAPPRHRFLLGPDALRVGRGPPRRGAPRLRPERDRARGHRAHGSRRRVDRACRRPRLGEPPAGAVAPVPARRGRGPRNRAR